jgi:DNA mismatch repair protein MutS
VRNSDVDARSGGGGAVAPLYSILYRAAGDPDEREPRDAPDIFHDLNLDQLVEWVSASCKDHDIVPYFHAPLTDVDAVVYRQEVMRDLDGRPLTKVVRDFADAMREVRQHLTAAQKLYYPYERMRWFVAAAQTWCAAVERLRDALAPLKIESRGMRSLRGHVERAAASEGFVELREQAAAVVAGLEGVIYGVLINDGAVTVRPYADEIDYTAEVEATFERFRRGAVKDYRAKFSEIGSLNHIEAQILDRVALLHPAPFGALEAFCSAHAEFLDPLLVRFDRELHFYLAVLGLVDRLRGAGLAFCYPDLSTTDKAIECRRGFDLALAVKLVQDRVGVVCNDFSLSGNERLIVVTGPNNGGKTTFARMFGQMHYWAALGCPVPGERARLFLCDRIHVHFERHEDISNLRGKLQDDLVRIRRLLDLATPRSIVILNEIFASTTLEDAVFLSRKVLARVSALDALAVCVTFLAELSAFDDRTVSMVSLVDPADPAIRTYRLERRPADGLAYALAVARKYRVTRDALLERIPA